MVEEHNRLLGMEELAGSLAGNSEDNRQREQNQGQAPRVRHWLGVDWGYIVLEHKDNNPGIEAPDSAARFDCSGRDCHQCPWNS